MRSSLNTKGVRAHLVTHVILGLFLVTLLCVVTIVGLYSYHVYNPKIAVSNIGYFLNPDGKERGPTSTMNGDVSSNNTTIFAAVITKAPRNIFDQRDFQYLFPANTYYRQSDLAIKNHYDTEMEILDILGAGIMSVTKEPDCGEKAAFVEWLLRRYGINASIVVTDNFQGTSCSQAWVKVKTPQNGTLFIDEGERPTDLNNPDNIQYVMENPGYIKSDEAHKHFDKEFKDVFEAEGNYSDICSSCRYHFAWWKTSWGKSKLKILGFYDRETNAINLDRLGSKLNKPKSYAEALDYFNRSSYQDPYYLDAWIHKGSVLLALKKYNASMESFTKALELNNSTIAAWIGFADAYTALGNYAFAADAMAKANEIDPKNKGNLLKEGQLLQLGGKYREANVKFDRALALDSKFRDAMYRKGLSNMALGNNSEAIILFDQALAVDPKFKQAYDAKGLALEAENKYAEALQAYDKALKIDPAYRQPLNNKMHALLALKKQSEATSIFLNI